MTEKQRSFARLVVAGMAPSEAYRLAGYRVSGMTARSVAVEAAHLQGHPGVAALTAQLRSQADQSAVLTMQRRREILQEIAENSDGSGAERVAAIREDAILAGERRTDGTTVTINGNVTIEAILTQLRQTPPAKSVFDHPVAATVSQGQGAIDSDSTDGAIAVAGASRLGAPLTATPVIRAPLGRLRVSG